MTKNVLDFWSGKSQIFPLGSRLVRRILRLTRNRLQRVVSLLRQKLLAARKLAKFLAADVDFFKNEFLKK